MYMLYKHKCSLCSVLRCALHVIRDYVEKVTLDVGGIPSQCLKVEHANTKSNAVYKKREVTTQRVYKVKQ